MGITKRIGMGKANAWQIQYLWIQVCAKIERQHCIATSQRMNVHDSTHRTDNIPRNTMKAHVKKLAVYGDENNFWANGKSWYGYGKSWHPRFIFFLLAVLKCEVLACTGVSSGCVVEPFLELWSGWASSPPPTTRSVKESKPYLTIWALESASKPCV